MLDLARDIIGTQPILATFLAIGILNWPLVAVVLALAPLSIAAAWPRPSSHA